MSRLQIRFSEMPDIEKEKVIDYAPATISFCRKCWIVTTGLFVLTWGLVAGLYFAFSGTDGSLDVLERLMALESQMKQVSEKLDYQEKITLSGLPSELPDQGISRKEEVVLDVVTHDEFSGVAERIKQLEDNAEKIQNLEIEVAKTKQIMKNEKEAEFSPLIMALVQVHKQIQKGQPFDTELSLAESQSGDDPVIAQNIGVLKAHAEKGVITSEQLVDEFSGLAGHLVMEANKSQDDNLWSKAKNKILDVVAIRRIDNLEGDSAEAIVARAEKSLQEYKLTDAIFELDRLGARPKERIADWLEKASARVAVEDAVDGIIERVTQISAKKESES